MIGREKQFFFFDKRITNFIFLYREQNSIVDLQQKLTMLTSSQPTDYTQQQYYSVDNSLNDQLINQAFVTNTQTYQSTNTKKNCYIPQIQQQFHPQLITTCKNNVLATMVKKNLVSSLLCFIHTTRKAPPPLSPLLNGTETCHTFRD